MKKMWKKISRYCGCFTCEVPVRTGESASAEKVIICYRYLLTKLILRDGLSTNFTDKELNFCCILLFVRRFSRAAESSKDSCQEVSKVTLLSRGGKMEAAAFEYHKKEETLEVESFQGMCALSYVGFCKVYIEAGGSFFKPLVNSVLYISNILPTFILIQFSIGYKFI